MPYHYIMANLLARADEAVGVLFMDGSGEPVHMACAADFPPHEVRVAGAYLGIYLRQLEAMADGAGLGAPKILHIERGSLHIFATALPDGYYLALLQRRPALAGKTRRSLAVAVEALRREVFNV